MFYNGQNFMKKNKTIFSITILFVFIFSHSFTKKLKEHYEMELKKGQFYNNQK
jgi:hypothetical protein